MKMLLEMQLEMLLKMQLMTMMNILRRYKNII
jgi:hypothetical protein